MDHKHANNTNGQRNSKKIWLIHSICDVSWLKGEREKNKINLNSSYYCSLFLPAHPQLSFHWIDPITYVFYEHERKKKHTKWTNDVCQWWKTKEKKKIKVNERARARIHTHTYIKTTITTTKIRTPKHFESKAMRKTSTETRVYATWQTIPFKCWLCDCGNRIVKFSVNSPYHIV